jgi:hypothetical protein
LGRQTRYHDEGGSRAHQAARALAIPGEVPEAVAAEAPSRLPARRELVQVGEAVETTTGEHRRDAGGFGLRLPGCGWVRLELPSSLHPALTATTAGRLDLLPRTSVNPSASTRGGLASLSDRTRTEWMWHVDVRGRRGPKYCSEGTAHGHFARGKALNSESWLNQFVH